MHVVAPRCTRTALAALLALCAVALAAAQTPIVVGGKPALQFEANLTGLDFENAKGLLKTGVNAGHLVAVAAVEGVELNGRFGFKFPIALAKGGTPSDPGCIGYLYVFSSGATYDNDDTSTGKRNELSGASARVRSPGTWGAYRIPGAGKNYSLDAILESPAATNRIHAEN